MAAFRRPSEDVPAIRRPFRNRSGIVPRHRARARRGEGRGRGMRRHPEALPQQSRDVRCYPVRSRIAPQRQYQWVEDAERRIAGWVARPGSAWTVCGPAGGVAYIDCCWCIPPHASAPFSYPAHAPLTSTRAGRGPRTVDSGLRTCLPARHHEAGCGSASIWRRIVSQAGASTCRSRPPQARRGGRHYAACVPYSGTGDASCGERHPPTSRAYIPIVQPLVFSDQSQQVMSVRIRGRSSCDPVAFGRTGARCRWGRPSSRLPDVGAWCPSVRPASALGCRSGIYSRRPRRS